MPLLGLSDVYLGMNPSTEALKAGTEMAETLHVTGWIETNDPNTGEPMQEQLPTHYIVEGILHAASSQTPDASCSSCGAEKTRPGKAAS